MGDIDNAPMPPMDNGMDGEPPMEMGDDSMMDSSQDTNASEIPPIDDGIGNDSLQGNDELSSVMDKLSTEDQAAVLKYAKSMADDSGEDDMNSDDGTMPESFYKYGNIIDEAINSIIYQDDVNHARREEKLPKRYRGKKTPFNSPFN